jgi:DNA polymerase-3 subunit beta
MKIEVSFERLKNLIGKAVNAVSKVGQNATLKGVYFEANSENGETLLIRSTNIDIGFESSIPCKLSGEGKFLISGEVLGRLLSVVNIKNKDLCVLILENNLLTVKVGKHEFTLKTLSFDNFPNLPKVEGVDVEFSASLFFGGLRSVVYAVAKSEIKPEISGVYVKMGGGNNNEMVFVATDAYRLAEKKVILPEDLPELSFILPEKNIKEILKIFGEDLTVNKKIKLTISKNSLQIQSGNLFLVSRLIEGNFPNYTQIIPSQPVSFAMFLKEDLLKSLRLVSFFTEKN